MPQFGQPDKMLHILQDLSRSSSWTNAHSSPSMAGSNDLQMAEHFAWKGFSPGHFPTVWTHRPPKAIMGMTGSLLAAGEGQSSWESVITAQGLAVFLPLVTAKRIFLQYTCNTWIISILCLLRKQEFNFLLAHSPLKLLVWKMYLLAFYFGYHHIKNRQKNVKCIHRAVIAVQFV